MRFAFGKNWRHFLRHLSDARVQSARASLKDMLMTDSLVGRRVLDAGSGSGLFSLAAVQLGAAEIVSFDYDPDSVACTASLNQKFGPFPNWTVRQGSVLDKVWLAGLGRFDVVYSWGVLHHTGAMWAAIDNVCGSVKSGGILYISIYNDQGAVSKAWTWVKRIYNRAPSWLQFLLVVAYLIPAALWFVVKGIAERKPPRQWLPLVNERGMHYYYDVVDWMGGYPFETATPEAIVEYVMQRGFTALKVNCRGGSGCNEFVFRRLSAGTAE